MMLNDNQVIINGKTRTCGLIGNPVEHTMSPVIHNNLALAKGHNMVYVPFHVMPEQVENAIKGAFALNVLGMNVTVPYKSDVIPFLADIDPLAQKIGAVNTLVRTEKGYKGYNTDMPGLYRAMCHDGITIKDKDVLILGAGGVARAVAIMLLDEGASHVIILNRSLERAQKIVQEVSSYSKEPDFIEAMELKDFDMLPCDKKYLVIQATSVGMHPHEEDVVIESQDFYKRVEVGYDLIFNPLTTRFMKLCREAGARAFNGYRMLLYQGIIAYELWNDTEVSNELAEAVYEKMVESISI